MSGRGNAGGGAGLKWHAWLAALLLAGGACSAGEAQGALPAGAVATVNGVAIMRAQVDGMLRQANAQDTAQTRQVVMRGLIGRELIRQAAEAEHLGDDPLVRTRSGEARVLAENQLYVQRHVHAQAVTDEAVKARYDAVVGELGPYEYQARGIVTRDAQAATRIGERLAQGSGFSEAVGKEPVTPFTLPWLSFGLPPAEGHTLGLPLPVAQALSTLRAGEATRTPLVRDGVYTVLQVVDRRKTRIPSFDEAKGAMRQTLEIEARRQAIDDLINGLAQRASIQQDNPS